MNQCEITDIFASNKQLKPTWVEFEHGSLNNNELSKVKCDVIFEDDNLSTTYLAWRDAEKSLILKGTKMQPKDQINQTLLMIKNRKTNKVRIVATDQLVVSNIINFDGMISDRGISGDAVSKQEVSIMFGSKKAQRQAVLNSRLEINQEIVRSKLEDSIAGIKIDVDSLNSSQEGSFVILPRCNANAKKVEEVYVLSDIIPEDVFESMTDMAEQVHQKPPENSDKEFSSFFVKCIQLSPGILKSSTQLIFLMYVDCLLRFLSIRTKNFKLESLFSVCQYSKSVRKHILHQFTIANNNNTRLRPFAMRDKAVCHSLVSLMIAFQYKLPLEAIQLAFPKFSLKRLQDFGKALRFSISPTSSFWLLKLPLPSANVFQKGRKQKR